MRISDLGRFAIAACLLLSASCNSGIVTDNEAVGDQAENVTTSADEADPCGSKSGISCRTQRRKSRSLRRQSYAICAPVRWVLRLGGESGIHRLN